MKPLHGRKWFCYRSKIKDNKNFFCCCNQKFRCSNQTFFDRTKYFVVVTNYCRYPHFNKWFCWYNKTFYTWSAPEVYFSLVHRPFLVYFNDANSLCKISASMRFLRKVSVGFVVLCGKLHRAAQFTWCVISLWKTH